MCMFGCVAMNEKNRAGKNEQQKRGWRRGSGCLWRCVGGID